MPEGPDYAVLAETFGEYIGNQLEVLEIDGKDYAEALGTLCVSSSRGKSLRLEGVKTSVSFSLGYTGKIRGGEQDGRVRIRAAEDCDIAFTTAHVIGFEYHEFNLPPDGLDIMLYESISCFIDSIIEAKKMTTSKRNIGKALTEQSHLLGIGNYIKCEALYLAGVHPDSPCRDIPHAKLKEILEHCHAVAHTCYNNGGTPVYSTNPVQTSMVYGKPGKTRVKTRDGYNSWIDEDVQLLY